MFRNYEELYDALDLFTSPTWYKVYVGFVERYQYFRALLIWVWILGTNMVPHSHIYFSSRGSDTLFWPLPIPDTHVIYIHMCRESTIINKINKSRHF